MGNRPSKKEHKEVHKNRNKIRVRAVPPLDHAYVRWLARDLARLHGFTPKNPEAIQPPENVIEFMQLYGWLDLDMNDPDLAPLFR